MTMPQGQKKDRRPCPSEKGVRLYAEYFYGDLKEAVYNTAAYFKYDYEDDWIVDPFVKK